MNGLTKHFLLSKKNKIIGIIGLGYVGLSLAYLSQKNLLHMDLTQIVQK